jgi:Putative Flp pilus-assembly TadE/G-like
MSRTPRHSQERGQMLVLMAGGIVAFLAMTALIVDGGNAWAQQRQTQNGTDAAAQAGATVLAQKLANDPASSGSAAATWDAATLAAVDNIASANKNDPPAAYYTDICGVVLKRDGSAASGITDAARVGVGFPDYGGRTTPTCPSVAVGPAAGVEVHDTKAFGTYFANAVGIKTFTAGALATAVTGFVASCQSADQGCAVLPVNIPVYFSVCAGQSGHDLVQGGNYWPLNTRVVLPLCFNTSGNIGWIDWYHTGGNNVVVQSVNSPNNPAISLPSWQQISQTGTDHSSTLDAALNRWDGKVVLLPMFDHTCTDQQPTEANVADISKNYGCTPGGLDSNGNSNWMWYRVPRFAAFQLEAAYTNGNNIGTATTLCELQSKQCLVGKFVRFVVSGQVGPNSGGGDTSTSVIGVQLIR